MNLIKLTLKDNNLTVYINIQYISGIVIHNDYTSIATTNGRFYDVEDTFIQIKEKIDSCNLY